MSGKVFLRKYLRLRHSDVSENVCCSGSIEPTAVKIRLAHHFCALSSLMFPAAVTLLLKLPLLLIAIASLCLASLASYAGDNETPAAQDLLVLAGQLADLSTDPAYGEYLASECLTCHRPVAGGEIPLLHGRESVDLSLALLEYKHSIRDNTTMRSVAGALSNEEIATLAQFFSTLEVN